MSSFMWSIPGDEFHDAMLAVLDWNLVMLGVWVVFQVLKMVFIALVAKYAIGKAMNSVNTYNASHGIEWRMPTRKYGPGY